MILLNLFVRDTVVPEKAPDELSHKNSQLAVWSSEILANNCASRAEKSNPQYNNGLLVMCKYFREINSK